MEDEPKTFTNRELWMQIRSNSDTNILQHETIKTSIDEFHKVMKETLVRIEAQTIKTNGSVKDLLLWRATVEGKTWILPIIIGATVSGLVALFFKAF